MYPETPYTDYARTGKTYRKIDIYYKEAGGWRYACSTVQWRLCRDAKQSWANIYTSGNVSGIKALFAK